jgi:hypothetical protein
MFIKVELDKDLEINETISINIVKNENKLIEGTLIEIPKNSEVGIAKEAPTNK